MVLFHGYDALQFLQANGPGSAEEMPHGFDLKKSIPRPLTTA